MRKRMKVDPNFSLAGMGAKITTHAHLGKVLAAIVVTYRSQGPDAGKAHLDELTQGLREAATDPDFLALAESLRAGIDDIERTQELGEIIW